MTSIIAMSAFEAFINAQSGETDYAFNASFISYKQRAQQLRLQLTCLQHVQPIS